MMRIPSQLLAPIGLCGLLGLGAAPSAVGCGFHNLDLQFGVMYPGSLSVAMALRNAADTGVIDAAAVEAVSNDPSRYVEAVLRLQAFRKYLAASPAAAELPASFSLGYVESHLWTRYAQSGGNLRADVHTDGPVMGEAIVLTAEPVLTEVLAGRLSLDRALADGMILIDGSESEKTAIRHVLKTTSRGSRIGSR
jgi:hypothetical protein